MKRSLILNLFGALLSLAASIAWADAPNLLTYQGRLLEGSPGLPVTGQRTVEIGVCPGAAGGTCVLTGAQQVAVVNGLFRSTFTAPASLNLFTGTHYLEVRVGPALTASGSLTALTPREQLSSVPYAVVSGTASVLAGAAGGAAQVAGNLAVTGPNATIGSAITGLPLTTPALMVGGAGNTGVFIGQASSNHLGLTYSAGNAAIDTFGAPLRINAGSNQDVRIGQLTVGASNVGLGSIAPQGRLSIAGTSITDPYLFAASHSLTGYAIAVATSGKVGLGGIISPVDTLHLVGNVNLSGGRVVNLGAPALASDAATKQYVDTLTGAASGGAALLSSTQSFTGHNKFVGQVSVSSHVALVSGGRIGVSTGAPQAHLHVIEPLANQHPTAVLEANNGGRLSLTRFDGGGGANLIGTLSNANVSRLEALGGSILINAFNAEPIRLATADRERLRVQGNGDVAIGTGTTANQHLHVMDTHDGSRGIRIENTSLGGLAYSQLELLNPIRQYNLGLAGPGVTTNAGKLFIYDATVGAFRFAINPMGQTGIGTESPTAQLHVSSGGAAAGDSLFIVSKGPAPGDELLAVKGDGTTLVKTVLEVQGPDLRLGTSDGRPNSGALSNRALVHSDTALDPALANDTLVLNFQGDFTGGTLIAGAGAGVGAKGLYVNNSGQVGVGTMQPGANLEVEGPDPTFAIDNSASGNVGIDLRHGGTTGAYIKKLAASGDLQVLSNSHITLLPGSGVKAAFFSNGQVGIGTLSGTSQLDVSRNTAGNGSILTLTNQNTGASSCTSARRGGSCTGSGPPTAPTRTERTSSSSRMNARAGLSSAS